MFIRWIVRGHKNSDAADVAFHDAYLVESYRDDEGKPRQRTIAYLGNIRQIGADFPAVERELFMLRAELILGEMKTLSPIDRQDILEQLAKKVPPLTQEEVMRAFKSNLQWYFQWWQENGNAPNENELLAMIKNIASEDDLISPD
ncbi:MAG: hypothetical protein AAFV93_19765 [Chloroflexota bacterium]